jgi:hypothetical protein
MIGRRDRVVMPRSNTCLVFFFLKLKKQQNTETTFTFHCVALERTGPAIKVAGR